VKFYTYVMFILLVLLISLGALAVGRYSLSWDNPASDFRIILLMRVPRVLVALMVGASLAASGTVYQSLFRNPLVSPDILGISAGACLGAALAILSPFQNPLVVPLCAFTFGSLAVFLSYQLASLSYGHPVMMLVMSGIVVSSFFSALLSLLKYLADPYQKLPRIVFWIMGGLNEVTLQDVYLCAPLVILGLAVIFALRRNLNVISLGDEEAASLGVPVRRLRLVFIACSTAVVGATISITGVIAWVGLIVPHLSRILVGADHRHSIPCAMLIGGPFLVVIDTLARTLTSQEIPIGILTSLIGAPFFAYLLLWKRDRGWGHW
jgi:iron complex transport system permease protein